eukprot:g15693.t1
MEDFGTGDPADVGGGVRRDVCRYPLPLVTGEKKGLKIASAYATTEQTATSFLMCGQMLFGEKATVNITRLDALTVDTVDIDCWQDDTTFAGAGPRLPLHIGNQSDQGPDCQRFGLLASAKFPMVWKPGKLHRSSNNSKYLAPSIVEAARASRKWAMGPLHSRANMGKMRACQVALLREAKSDPAKTTPTVNHGTSCRWNQIDKHNRSMQQSGILTKFIVNVMAEEEDGTGFMDPETLENSDGHGVPWYQFNDREYFEEGDEIHEDVDDSTSTAAEFDGYATEYLSFLEAVTEEDERAMLDLGRCQTETHDLLEHITSRGHDDKTTLSNPYYFTLGQKYLGDDITTETALSVVEINDRMQKYRLRQYEIQYADTCKALGNSKTHLKCGLPLLAKILMEMAHENWDPQFGLWESVAEKRVGCLVAPAGLRRLATTFPWPCPLFGLRASKSLITGKKKLLSRQVRNHNRSWPPTERRNEEQFREHLNAARIKSGTSWWTKQLDRVRRCERDPRYPIAPAVGRPDRLSDMDPEAIFNPLREQKFRARNDSAYIESYMKDERKARVSQHNEQESKYLAQRCMDVREELALISAKEVGHQLRPTLTSLVGFVTNPQNKTVAPDRLGIRGVFARNQLQYEYDLHELQFHQSCGARFFDRWNVKEQLKRRGGVAVRPKRTGLWSWMPICGDGFVLGTPFCGTDQAMHHRLPHHHEELAFWPDLWDHCDFYFGETGSLDDGEYNRFFVIDDTADKVITWQEMQATHFPSASKEMQIRMLLPFTKQDPRLTRAIFEKCSVFTRRNCFSELIRGNPLPEKVIEKLVELFGPRYRVLARSAEVVNKEIQEEMLKKQAEKAQNPDSPGEKRQRLSTSSHAGTFSREEPAAVLHFYDLRKNPPTVVACVRSHRNEQGAIPDTLRLNWPWGFNPQWSYHNPSCEVGADPIASARAVFLPRVIREFGGDADSYTITRQENPKYEGDYITPFAEWQVKPKPKAAPKAKAAAAKPDKKDEGAKKKKVKIDPV